VSLLFGLRGAAAQKPAGDHPTSQQGHQAARVCVPQAPSSSKEKTDKKGDKATKHLHRPLGHVCPSMLEAVALTHKLAAPAHLLPPSPPTPALPLAPQAATAATLPINVATLTAALTTLPATNAAAPSGAVASPTQRTAAPSTSGTGPASQTPRQAASAIVPPPPLVLRLPNLPAVIAGAAVPALAGVVAPAIGVTAACILAGLLGSILLVRRR
jgi:hypothetical protein